MDDSEQAEEALKYAVEENPAATVTLVHAYGIPEEPGRGAVVYLDDEAIEAARQHAEAIFERGRELAAQAGHEGDIETVAEQGDPEEIITSQAEEADAIIMGSHGRDGATRVLLGSVAEKVVRRSPIPVTVVK